MRPAVSVVLTVYNATWCVERALDAVVAQDFPASEIEVLVCDDGSSDGTPDLVERRYGDRVRVLRLPHRNASATRGVGLAEARGKWLAFLDADDWWEPNKLSAQWAYLEAHPALRWISTDGDFVSAEGVIRESWLADYFSPVTERCGDLFPMLLHRCFPLLSSVLVERDAYHEAGGLDPAMVYSHDYDLWMRVMARHPAAVMTERLVHYWYHAGSLSRRLEARHRDDLALMERVARGELRPDAATRRVGRRRASSLAFQVAVSCLRDGRVADARGMFRRALVGGPLTRRALAAAGCVLPAGLLPALARMPGLKRRIAGARDPVRSIPGPGDRE
jgi:glycosyltransferase involved in cell wall biosynthesis